MVLRKVLSYYRAVFLYDPAARNGWEVALCYPGLHALTIHTITHGLWKYPYFKLIARVISHVNRFVTGIEIHPGAEVGYGVFIDHGMGVVIGETAVVEDSVVLFHGVTLGGTGKNKGKKRHPTIERGAYLGARATILGPIIVGRGTKVGAGAVVLKSVPPDHTVVGITPAQRVVQNTLP